MLVGSPALYAAQVTGTLSPDVAMVRLMVCLVGVWAACSLVVSIAQNTVAANERATEEPEVDLDLSPIPMQSEDAEAA
ncbi:hypothetical protein ABLE68_04835 [Nocardioides sp. CN2-186]|uniref:hypothetical protein n=1 Tax=Nocardioides tweenelious TaxID=3156607 RepID=UPI0032B4A229